MINGLAASIICNWYFNIWVDGMSSNAHSLITDVIPWAESPTASFASNMRRNHICKRLGPWFWGHIAFLGEYHIFFMLGSTLPMLWHGGLWHLVCSDKYYFNRILPFGCHKTPSPHTSRILTHFRSCSATPLPCECHQCASWFVVRARRNLPSGKLALGHLKDGGCAVCWCLLLPIQTFLLARFA